MLDIASAPGGCDSAYCKEKHVPYKLALGLPGLYCPKTSAMILLEAMPFGYKPNPGEMEVINERKRNGFFKIHHWIWYYRFFLYA